MSRNGRSEVNSVDHYDHVMIIKKKIVNLFSQMTKTTTTTTT